MRAISIIAANTFREIIRDRILYGIVVFAVLLFGLSMAMGQLSFSEQARVSANFGLAAIQLGAAILSIFVGSTLVAREIEKKTIMTLLARPISRGHFIIGKFFGLLAVVSVCTAGLASVLTLIMYLSNYPADSLFLLALYGVLLESALLLAVTIFFGTFSSPMLSVSFVIGIFIIGHWVESLRFFVENSRSHSFRVLGDFIVTVMPNLEMLNWRSLFIYRDSVSWENVLSANLYAGCWIIGLICVAAFILRQRDLG